MLTPCERGGVSGSVTSKTAVNFCPSRETRVRHAPCSVDCRHVCSLDVARRRLLGRRPAVRYGHPQKNTHGVDLFFIFRADTPCSEDKKWIRRRKKVTSFVVSQPALSRASQLLVVVGRLTLRRTRWVYVYVLTFWAVELDGLHMRLVPNAQRNNRLSSAQKVRAVAELLSQQGSRRVNCLKNYTNERASAQRRKANDKCVYGRGRETGVLR